ncbi:hypothetical protein PR048_028121 [Dryococelus australis]|uniref:Uncharacterized protein n=1 Tax=Dryococelus australis TaxID=614101 RepID=A0ABQ9GID9_9NEOP|nr:hypothetical protein PR048_028121 [Dryococelus australis]
MMQRMLGINRVNKRQAWSKAKMTQAVRVTTLRQLEREVLLSPEGVVMKMLGRKPIYPEKIEND